MEAITELLQILFNEENTRQSKQIVEEYGMGAMIGVAILMSLWFLATRKKK